MSDVVLYEIPLSHSALAARMMLEYKGIALRRRVILSGFHPLWVRLAGFSAGSVPALRVRRRRIQGSLAISRFLDELQAEPALFPRDPETRREVERAEAWGERTLQPVPRRLTRWALMRDGETRRMLARMNGLPLAGLMAVLMQPLAAHFARVSGADDATVRRDLDRLPRLLDHTDALVRRGVIGAEVPNAATFQIAPSLRLLMNFESLAELIERRPSGAFARSLLPDYPVPSGRGDTAAPSIALTPREGGSET